MPRQASRRRVTWALLALGLVAPASSALAAWPAEGVLVTPTPMPSYMGSSAAVSDGHGGVLVASSDNRSGVWLSVYVQHALETGTVDPAWPPQGVAVYYTGEDQRYVQMIDDGAGGAIVSWVHDEYDYGTNSRMPALYVHHVLGGGSVDPAWGIGGRILCDSLYDVSSPRIIPDKAGGALVAWVDAQSRVRAQHIVATGALAPGWPATGRVIGNGQHPDLALDAAGGLVVAWANGPIRVKRLLASGQFDPGWPDSGAALRGPGLYWREPRLVPDLDGGATVAFEDVAQVDTDGWVHTEATLCAGVLSASGAVSMPYPTPLSGGPQYEVYMGVSAISDGLNGLFVSGLRLPVVHHLIADTHQDTAHPYGWSFDATPDGWGGCFHSAYDDFSNRYPLRHDMPPGVADPAWPESGGPTFGSPPRMVPDGVAGTLCVFYGTGGIRVQRYGPAGEPGYFPCRITRIADVPGDQGGFVELSWTRCAPDTAGNDAVSHYDIERRDAGENWVFAGTLPAIHPGEGAPPYHTIVPTLRDSLASDGPQNPRTVFRVVGRSVSGGTRWPSPADSGSSVDNLAPATPADFAGEYSGAGIHLTWSPNSESDLVGYRLYRDPDAAFVPGPDTRIASTTATGYSDPAGAAYYYKLCAQDVHGNESVAAGFPVAGTLGLGLVAPKLDFSREGANPAQGPIRFRIELPGTRQATLGIFDLQGRRVRRLLSSTLPAGAHSVEWDGRDDEGRFVGAGLYFACLEAGGRSLTRSVVVSR